MKKGDIMAKEDKLKALDAALGQIEKYSCTSSNAFWWF